MGNTTTTIRCSWQTLFARRNGRDRAPGAGGRYRCVWLRSLDTRFLHVRCNDQRHPRSHAYDRHREPIGMAAHHHRGYCAVGTTGVLRTYYHVNINWPQQRYHHRGNRYSKSTITRLRGQSILLCCISRRSNLRHRAHQHEGIQSIHDRERQHRSQFYRLYPPRIRREQSYCL